jgi:hypothetical protein
VSQAIAQTAAVPAARFDPVKVALLVLALVLALLAAYRVLGSGADYNAYFAYYLTVTEYYSSNVSRFEVGFQYWSWFAANRLYLSFPVFYAITAFVPLYIKFDLLWKYTYAPWFAILTYIVLFYPVHEYTQIRVAVALALIFVGIFTLNERRYVLAALAFALALAFHASAAIVIVIAIGAMFIPLHFTMIGLSVTAVAMLYYSELITALILQLFNFNDTIERIVDNPELYEVNFLSVTNLCLAISTGLCVAGGAHHGKLGRTFLTMSISAFVFMILFQASPVLAQRIKEMLWLAIIFLAFRPVTNRPLLAARVLLVLGGAWSVYRGIGEGLLG